jgi:glycosyltransferase involved in cell wall biosynthesis
MRIAQVASLWASIPPRNYGGIELLVHLLTEELVRRGHEVTLFASGDSRTNARLCAICQSNIVDTMGRGEAYDYEYYATAAIAEAIRDWDQFDIIHSHLGASKIPLSIAAKSPIVHTLHTFVTIDDQWVFRRYPEATVVAVSHSQIANVPEESRHNFHVSHNGCDFDTYDLADPPGKYLVFLGRMASHKNPVDAIRIAQAVGMPLVMAGKPQAHPEEIYFQDEVKPLIDGKRVRYIGPVNHEQKRELLKNAAAFLFPTSWPEPFGLAPVEALASGLPVLAYSNGAVAEVIDYGVTGFYADSLETLIALVPEALALDRKAIREHARKRFNHHRMVDDYLRIFRTVIKGRDS